MCFSKDKCWVNSVEFCFNGVPAKSYRVVITLERRHPMKITVLLEGEKSTFAKGKILELIFQVNFFGKETNVTMTNGNRWVLGCFIHLFFVCWCNCMWLGLFLLGNGNCRSLKGLEIAIRQRIDDALTSKLPVLYVVNRSFTYLVNTVQPIQVNVKQRSLSLNWTLSDVQLEVVDGLNGKVTERSDFFPYSLHWKCLATLFCASEYLAFNIHVEATV